MRPRYTPPHPWRPLTDAEYEALLPYLPPPGRRGRPPANRRRTLDAIFWIACSREPWRALPPHLGRADTAHRQLRRWARAGVLDRLLLAVSGKDPTAPAVLRRLEYRVCRAWRRAARLMGVGSLSFARRLGLLTALPCDPRWLPDPILSEIAHSLANRLLENAGAAPLAAFRDCRRLLAAAGGSPRRFRLK
mgnify:CR=1 FL=1